MIHRVLRVNREAAGHEPFLRVQRGWRGPVGLFALLAVTWLLLWGTPVLAGAITVVALAVLGPTVLRTELTIDADEAVVIRDRYLWRRHIHSQWIDAADVDAVVVRCLDGPSIDQPNTRDTDNPRPPRLEVLLRSADDAHSHRDLGDLKAWPARTGDAQNDVLHIARVIAAALDCPIEHEGRE